MSTETSCHFSHLLQVSKNLVKVWFYTQFFMIVYIYIAPGQRLTAPWGQNFDVNRNILSLRSFVTSFKKISLKYDFIHFFFHDFIHVHSPGAWADSRQGTKFWYQEKRLVTSFICCKFQRNLFKVWFYTFFFHSLIHVYSLGARAYNPHGTTFWCQQKNLITSPICYKFQKKKIFEVWLYTFFFSLFNTCM